MVSPLSVSQQMSCLCLCLMNINVCPMLTLNTLVNVCNICHNLKPFFEGSTCFNDASVEHVEHIYSIIILYQCLDI